MLFAYPAILHKEDGAYWLEFPDLEGCQTFGDNVNEVMVNAQEALRGYLLTLLDNERAIPKPSELSLCRESDSFSTLVTCDVN